MHYKTMILEMLQQCPELHNRLRQSRTLPATVNQYASELRDIQLAWEEQLAIARPSSDPRQIASEALEMALHEMQRRLLAASQTDEETPLTLDAAMAFIRAHTPPA